MNCQRFRAAYLAREASPGVMAHLHRCARCRTERPHLEGLRSALSNPDLWHEPDPGLRERVLARLGEQSRPAGRSRRRWWIAAAALLMLVAGTGVWTALRTPQPSWEVTLVGTELAPRATGVVRGWETPSGTAVFLRIEGLQPAPQGNYYELWFRGPEGLVSAGTFRAAPGFELWAAATLEEYPQVGVTLEPDDGDPSRNGLQVMGSRAAP